MADSAKDHAGFAIRVGDSVTFIGFVKHDGYFPGNSYVDKVTKIGERVFGSPFLKFESYPGWIRSDRVLKVREEDDGREG